MTISELKSRLSKSIDFLQDEFNQIRTGRANPKLLEDLQLEVYESRMTIKELGSVTLHDSHTVLISPWDKSLLPQIAKSIRDSELNLSPVEVNDNLKVPIPPLTEDRRKELAKVVMQKVEDTKMSLRSIRHDAIRDVEKEFSEKTIGEDEKFTMREEIDGVVKEYVDESDKMGDAKNDDLMDV